VNLFHLGGAPFIPSFFFLTPHPDSSFPDSSPFSKAAPEEQTDLFGVRRRNAGWQEEITLAAEEELECREWEQIDNRHWQQRRERPLPRQ
jgi:hypothetical protein